MQEHEDAEEPIEQTPAPDAAFAAVDDLLATIADPKRHAARSAQPSTNARRGCQGRGRAERGGNFVR